jgi:type VI secretion system protein VasD
MNTDAVSVHHPMRRKLLFAAWAVGLTLAGCASGPKPLAVTLTIEAAPGVNPDQRGRPSPVALKLFELKSLTNFERADFFSLFDRDRETLGPELVARDEMVIKPGDRIVQERKLAPEVRFIGVLVGYRDLERSQWRLSIPVETARNAPLVIQLDAARVALKGK